MYKIRLVSAQYKLAIYNKKKHAVAETMLFLEWQEYRAQTSLVMCVKLLKDLGDHFDCIEMKNVCACVCVYVCVGGCWIGLKRVAVGSMHTRWDAQKHAHTYKKNQVGPRQPFNTHLRPRLERQSTSSPGALQLRASLHAPPNFTHGCTPVKVFHSGFCFSWAVLFQTIFSTIWKRSQTLSCTEI